MASRVGFRAVFCALTLALAVGVGEQARAVDLAEAVPPFALEDHDGVTRASQEWEGRTLVVNFWAPWCGPCRTEIPELAAAQEQLAPRGFVFLGIALDGPDAVARFMTETSVGYDVLIVGNRRMELPQRFSEDFLGLPATVFADARGRLVWGRAAAMSAEEVLAAAERVEQVNAGTLSIEQARTEIDEAMAAIAAERLFSPP